MNETSALCPLCGHTGAEEELCDGIMAHTQCVLVAKIPFSDEYFTLVSMAPELAESSKRYFNVVIQEATTVRDLRERLEDFCRYLMVIGRKLSAHIVRAEQDKKDRLEKICEALDRLFENIQQIAEYYLLEPFDTLAIRSCVERGEVIVGW